jgi:hypothetical protein
MSCVPQLWTLPPCRGGLRRCHVAPASPPREESSSAATYPTAPSEMWAIGIKKGLAAPGTQLGSHVSKATVRFNSATQAQLTTPGHDYSDDTTRQDGTMGRARFSVAE